MRTYSQLTLLGLILFFCAYSLSWAEPKNTAWDVNNPPGKSIVVPIEVTEGTWMNVDVSPSGDTLVFDLLGDLYLLPITGGEAKQLTSGMAWDMQPRFSPDGNWITYTSDAGGGDNIWVINRDGSQAEQVTKESFRLLNNPAWSPDGRFIVGRKHFTSSRSLGAGEIWMYHRTGGSGIQLNQRPNNQKDLGEPIFSPDGKKVYFSRDSTPGQIFEYSKDSNQQIYEIFSIDRETGDIEREVSGPGGAVRPTPSPDGQKLAFVRRIRNQSSLFVKDLSSGAITPVYQQLDRDMQETWAIHGVYPNFAWSPDSRDLIFWAGGQIHRLNTQTLATDIIPFSIKDSREIRAAQRLPVEVAPERFNAKMLRWVQVAPNNDFLIFEALGKLYRKDLPNGKPYRLTKQENHFELYPTISSDSRSIVYTTWNDQELGTLRRISSKGGRGKSILDQPGHYIEPTISPDKQTIVFRKIAGGYLRSPLFSQDTGIYRVEWDGGNPVRLTTNGRRPHFASSNEKLFFETTQRAGGNQQTSLIELDLERYQQHQRLNSSWVSEYKVSPDGRWIAFVERFQVFVAPYTEAGTAIKSGAASKSLPTIKVSDFAGENLSWSKDGSNLYWSQGDTLYTQQLPAQLESSSSLAPPSSSKINLTVEADSPDSRYLLTNARVVTMQGDKIFEKGDIAISGNRIVGVGESGSVETPRGAKVINLAGKTVIPGLVDVHWHGSQGRNEIIPQQNWVNLANLAFGVTTLHDPSNDTSTIFAASELARAGKILAPRIFSTGTILYGAETAFMAEVDSRKDALDHLKRMSSVGAISVKSYNQPRRDQRQQILDAAREVGIMVVPEGGSLLQHNLTMIVDGHTGIEHAIPVADIYADVEQLWSQTKVGYTPTLTVAFGGVWGEHYWYQESDVWKHPLLSKYVPQHVLWPRAIRRITMPKEDFNHFNTASVAAKLQSLGVLVNAGAHGQREGLGTHWEIWMFAQGGMSPLQALRTATIDAAQHLGFDNDIGSIEAGKLADLVILNANPLDNIRNSEKIDRVILNGRIFDADTMNEMGKQRPKLYFE